MVQITQDELVEMFGAILPMDAAKLLFVDLRQDVDVEEIRKQLRIIAKRERAITAALEAWHYDWQHGPPEQNERSAMLAAINAAVEIQGDI